jgi:hypothetical protein
VSSLGVQAAIASRDAPAAKLNIRLMDFMDHSPKRAQNGFVWASGCHWATPYRTGAQLQRKPETSAGKIAIMSFAPEAEAA